MRKKVFFILFYAIIIGLVSFQFSCSASRPPTDSSEQSSQEEDYDEIERLLGITEEDKQAARAGEEEQNDELLELLEAGEKKGKEPTAAETGAVSDARIAQLQKQIDQLRKQLREKNILIADLKAQLRMKEEQLRRYQSEQGTAIASATETSPLFTSPTPQNLDDVEYRQRYEQGLSLFNQKRYREAIKVFQSLLATNTEHELADNAQYWIGECYYMLGDYQAAIVAFEKVFTFPQSNKNDYAQYKLGLCYYQLGERQQARAEFQRLIDNYKNSPLVEKARQYLNQI